MPIGVLANTPDLRFSKIHNMYSILHSTFHRLPFGMSSAPEHSKNRMVTEVTDGLQGVVCHMDDALVGVSRRRSMTYCDGEVQKASITLNVDKCDLSKQEVAFLGHIISSIGISPQLQKTGYKVDG